MSHIFNRMWQEDDGVLSFEWTLLTLILGFGIVAGLSGARDAILDELGDTAEAYLSIDQSFSFAGIPGVFDPVEYVDPGHTFADCSRGGALGPIPPWDIES
jgi:Flp pilus assembly pilin Flp